MGGDLLDIIQFLRAAEALKTATRSGWTSAGERESVAEHTWRLCLMALLLHPSFPDVDFARLIKICIVHDLGEAIGGDVPAPEQARRAGSKSADERRDLIELLKPLPASLREEITGLWDEYDAARTPEAKLAKALDKLETILQHTQGRNPAGFDYRFNIGYGRQFTRDHPVLEAMRALLDEETERRAREADGRARGSADAAERTSGVVKTPAPLTTDALLASLPPATRRLANRIREIVRRAVPTLTERALPGWRAIGFRDPQAGHVCALFPFGPEVRLYIEHGARLDDPDGLLQGTMKRGRYVAFRSERDVRARAVTSLVRRAVVLQSL